MDEFKQKINELNELSDEEKKEQLDKLAMDCVCPLCPSYNDCAKEKEEWLFCVTGSSDGCIDREKGCSCPECPFAKKYQIGVKHNFYCTLDSEMEQRMF